MDAFQILVIILAGCLGLFLILGIALVISLIRLSRRINRIADNIEDASGSLKNIMASLNQLASPVLLFKLIVRQLKLYINNKRRMSDGKERKNN